MTTEKTTHSDNIEYCVSCGEPTQYKKSDPVDLRYDYVDGAGQLCHQCYTELVKPSSR